MSQQTPAQTRVVDPILSEHARGYVRPGNVGHLLFPLAPVPAYGGQVIEFGKEAFRLYNTRRAPGANTKRIDLGYAGKPYAIVPNAIEVKVPRELMVDASQVPGIDLGANAVNGGMGVLKLEHEYSCAQLARNAANYDAAHKLILVGADRWTGASSDPGEDVANGVEAIRRSIGVRPNVAILSATAFAALQFNAKILERIKYTGRDSVTVEILAKLWNIKNVYVGEAVVATGQNDDFGDVWGNDVILAYVADGVKTADGRVQGNSAEPSFGYTYAITGMPLVEKPYWDASAKSWIYGTSDDASPVLSGMTAGYLIKDAGAPAA